jgi:hypothetical protein
MPLAAKMVDLLNSDQERKLAKSKRLLNRAKELEDQLKEFEIQRCAIS